MKQTPLHNLHLNSQAKMVDFHGWSMPLNYGSQIKEHLCVRESVGMFDVSHMNVLDITGPDGYSLLSTLLTNDIEKLTNDGQALYTCMCQEDGGIIDDLIVYRMHQHHYRLILNAATREKDLDWIGQHSKNFDVNLHEHANTAMIAIQGPDACAYLQKALNQSISKKIANLMPFTALNEDTLFIARTGYTGEDGFEVVAPVALITDLWQNLLSMNVPPCGLAARDTLRIEAGLMLYGQDMTSDTTPYEAGLGFTVSLSNEARDFIGKRALLEQKKHGCAYKMIGLLLEGRGVMRPGQTILIHETAAGVITSGTYSPSLERSIAFARISSKQNDNIQVLIRNQPVPAKLVKPRFVKQGVSLI